VKSGVATPGPGTCSTGPLPAGVLVGVDVPGRGGAAGLVHARETSKVRPARTTRNFMVIRLHVVGHD
jgi:hypothetical protein